MAASVRIAGLSEIPPGSVFYYEQDGLSVAIANCDGTLYAVDNVCTHDGGPLNEGEIYCDTFEIECPRHGATFDLRSGRVTALPAVRPIGTYPVTVQGDDVLIEVDGNR